MPPLSVPSVAADAVPDGAWLLNVREDDEWAAGHAPRATHVPLGQLMARLGDVPADREVVVVCRVGARSLQAAAYLNAMGRRAVNLAGGMEAWAAAGRPMVSEAGTAPVVL